MSVQEFSQGPRFAIFSPRGRKSSVIIRYILKQGPVAAGARGALKATLTFPTTFVLVLIV